MYDKYVPVAKLVVQVSSSLGVAKILGDVVRNNVTVTSTFQALTVKTGTFVLASMLCEQATNHVERQANELVGWVKKKKTEIDEAADDTGDDAGLKSVS